MLAFLVMTLSVLGCRSKQPRLTPESTPASASQPPAASVSPRPTASISLPEAAGGSPPRVGFSEARARLVPKVQKITHPLYGPGLIRYPEASVASPEATRAINDSLAQIVADNYDPSEDLVGLNRMDYSVAHNGNGILSLTIDIDWNGAYPSSWSEYHCYWLRTGEELTAAAIVAPAKLQGLLSKLDVPLQKELEQTLQSVRLNPEAQDVPLDRYVKGHFTVDNLKSFSVGSTGVTFFYTYNVPHVWKYYEPPGTFFLSYAELEPFLLPDGPLAGLVRASSLTPPPPHRLHSVSP